MPKDVYRKLAKYMDSQPTGYPATESGVELRILERLFSPDEAELTLQVRLKLEPAKVIAARVGLDEEAALEQLRSLSQKGLIFSIDTPGRPAVFMSAPFMVGMWEYNVNNLDEDLVRDVNDYLPEYTETGFGSLPQFRTIPVARSIEAGMKVLAYDQAEELIKEQKKFLVAPCICRKEHKMVGEGCDKLLEACLIFGWGADYYERNGIGRVITQDEALDVLKKAEADGLVLQPGNSQEIVNFCCCCGDCCQVLLYLKRHPKPAQFAFSSFVAEVDEDACEGCEVCLDRCQMDALTMIDDVISLNVDRCIGCGLCISTCTSKALRLARKPEEDTPEVPKTYEEAMVIRAKARIQAEADLKSKLARHEKV